MVDVLRILGNSVTCSDKTTSDGDPIVMCRQALGTTLIPVPAVWQSLSVFKLIIQTE